MQVNATTPVIPNSRIIDGNGPGTTTGRWADGPVHRVAQEFGRGPHGRGLEISTLGANENIYRSHEHAIRAASILSAGSFLGAVALDHGNFVGAELLRLGVDTVGSGGMMSPYEFESIAATAKGRRLLEQTLKLDMLAAVVDGAWTAVRTDEAGNVRLLATEAYLRELREPAR